MAQVYDLGYKIRQTAVNQTKYQKSLGENVIEELEEYVSIIHTLPVLVKLHDEAMALYDEIKQKGSVSSP